MLINGSVINGTAINASSNTSKVHLLEPKSKRKYHIYANIKCSVSRVKQVHLPNPVTLTITTNVDTISHTRKYIRVEGVITGKLTIDTNRINRQFDIYVCGGSAVKGDTNKNYPLMYLEKSDYSSYLEMGKTYTITYLMSAYCRGDRNNPNWGIYSPFLWRMSKDTTTGNLVKNTGFNLKIHPNGKPRNLSGFTLKNRQTLTFTIEPDNSNNPNLIPHCIAIGLTAYNYSNEAYTIYEDIILEEGDFISGLPENNILKTYKAGYIDSASRRAIPHVNYYTSQDSNGVLKTSPRGRFLNQPKIKLKYGILGLGSFDVVPYLVHKTKTIKNTLRGTFKAIADFTVRIHRFNVANLTIKTSITGVFNKVYKPRVTLEASSTATTSISNSVYITNPEGSIKGTGTINTEVSILTYLLAKVSATGLIKASKAFNKSHNTIINLTAKGYLDSITNRIRYTHTTVTGLGKTRRQSLIIPNVFGLGKDQIVHWMYREEAPEFMYRED